jgi:hypothetical protein
MSEKIEYVKDGNGKIIGQIRGDWILNSKSEQVARFDKGINRTRRADASIVGFGDQRLRELGQIECWK